MDHYTSQLYPSLIFLPNLFLLISGTADMIKVFDSMDHMVEICDETLQQSECSDQSEELLKTGREQNSPQCLSSSEEENEEKENEEEVDLENVNFLARLAIFCDNPSESVVKATVKPCEKVNLYVGVRILNILSVGRIYTSGFPSGREIRKRV